MIRMVNTMKAGNIIKVIKDFNIHKVGIMGVIVCSSGSDNLSVILSDGHFLALLDESPFTVIGYKREFDKPSAEFSKLVARVKYEGVSAFYNDEGVVSTVAVWLTDSVGGKICFDAGFCQHGLFYMSEALGKVDEGTHTETAMFSADGISFITINGDGWRDIDAGCYLTDFLSDVIFGDREADEFLVNIAEALGVNGEPGMLVA